MKQIICTLLIALATLPSYAQMLFSENLTMHIDSGKRIQGTLSPMLDFKTEQKNVFVFKNTANLNLLIGKKQVINLINKLEISTYDKKIVVSGGYVHAEYRYLLRPAFEVYPYAESQWAESRGMIHKVSAGVMSRYRLVHSERCILFATAGLFFEYEKWQYPEETAGTIAKHAYSRNIKSHVSLSFQHKLGERWEVTTTAIHQATPDAYLKKARFGGSLDLKFRITPAIGIRGAYRLIYDTAPIVPVRKGYHAIEACLDVSF